MSQKGQNDQNTLVFEIQQATRVSSLSSNSNHQPYFMLFRLFIIFYFSLIFSYFFIVKFQCLHYVAPRGMSRRCYIKHHILTNCSLKLGGKRQPIVIMNVEYCTCLTFLYKLHILNLVLRKKSTEKDGHAQGRGASLIKIQLHIKIYYSQILSQLLTLKSTMLIPLYIWSTYICKSSMNRFIIHFNKKLNDVTQEF